MLAVATTATRVQSRADARIESRERPVVVVVGPGVASGPVAQRPNHKTVAKDGGAAAAWFRNALLPIHADGASDSSGVRLAEYIACGVLLHFAVRVVNANDGIGFQHAFRIPAGEENAGGQPPAEFQQSGIVPLACRHQLRAAENGRRAQVDSFRVAILELVEPSRLHGPRLFRRGHAVVCGEEIGDEGVCVGIVQQRARTLRGTPSALEVDPCHGVLQSAWKPIGAALDVDMEFRTGQCLEGRRARIEEAMGNFLHPQPGSALGSARR